MNINHYMPNTKLTTRESRAERQQVSRCPVSPRPQGSEYLRVIRVFAAKECRGTRPIIGSASTSSSTTSSCATYSCHLPAKNTQRRPHKSKPRS